MENYLIVSHIAPFPPMGDMVTYARWDNATSIIEDVLISYCNNGDTYWQVIKEDYDYHFHNLTLPSSGGIICSI